MTGAYNAIQAPFARVMGGNRRLILKRTGRLETPGPDTPEANPTPPPPGPMGPGILRVNSRLADRYEIMRVLGRGGMSTVYRAIDRRFKGVERVVAIKEMFNTTQDAEARRVRLATFEREASLLATMHHPAIPRIYDYFTHNGRIYLVLECIEGENLETLLDHRDQAIPESDLVNWGAQICELLSYLHNRTPAPIIFRDLKPSNIMLRADSDQIVLIDFGIARTFQGDQRGTMIGTEGYAPPEQYRGLAGPPGDIYALGATLHHLATNNDPRLETPFTFHQRPPRQLNPALSNAFEEVILKAVAYKVEDRFTSSEEMRQALIGTRALPVTLNQSSSSMLPPAMVSAALPPKRAANKLATRLLEEARGPTDRLVWTIRTGDEVRSSPVADNEHVYVGSYDGKLYAVRLRDGGIIWQMETRRGICATPAVHNDTVVIGSEDSSVYGVKRRTGRQLWTYRTGLPIRSSPRIADDRVYIGSDDGNLYCLDLATGALVWRSRTWSHVRSSAAFADGLVLVGSDDGYLYAVESERGSVLWRFQTPAPIVSSPCVAYGTVCFGSMDGSLYAIRTSGGERVWSLATGQSVLSSVTERDGVIYASSTSGLFYAIRLQDGQVLWQYEDPSQITSTATTDEYGVYYGSGDGYVRCLYRADGQLAWQFKTGGPVPSSPTIVGQTLYIGSTDHRLYALRLDDWDVEE